MEEQPTKKAGHHILRRTLEIANQPSRHFTEPFRLLKERRYHRDRPFPHKVLDVLGLTMTIVAIALAVMILWPGPTGASMLAIHAQVTPREVVSGSRSVLAFHFENKTEHALSNVRVDFAFPEHFAVESVTTETIHGGERSITIGEIGAHGRGVIHVAGTMYGDVGGAQTFVATANFSDEEGHELEKITSTDFFPVRSTLALMLELPAALVAGGTIEGRLIYANVGDQRFPSIAIVPTWPEGFVLEESSIALQNGRFVVQGLDPEEEGVIDFTGTLGAAGDATFVFDPSFSFDDGHTYRQETLTQTVAIVAAPLTLSIESQEAIASPGGTLSYTVHYENRGETTVQNLTLTPRDKSAMIASVSPPALTIGTLAPGASGNATFTVTFASSIAKSSDLNVRIGAGATLSIDDGAKVTIESPSIDLTVTTPISLQAFARYSTPSGDQLGRGPLPPVVGETTKYWIFWTIQGTGHDLDRLTIRAELPANVSFTGRQSVPLGDAVTTSNGDVVWNVDQVPTTLGGSAPTVAVGFEVALTPTADQVGTIAKLLERTTLTAHDAVTGDLVTASSSVITIDLPNDALAAGQNRVAAE